MWYNKNGNSAGPKDGDLVRITMDSVSMTAGVEILSYVGPLSGIDVPLSRREGNLLEYTEPLFVDNGCLDTVWGQGISSDSRDATRRLAELVVASAHLCIDGDLVSETDKVRVYLVTKPD